MGSSYLMRTRNMDKHFFFDLTYGSCYQKDKWGKVRGIGGGTGGTLQLQQSRPVAVAQQSRARQGRQDWAVGAEDHEKIRTSVPAAQAGLSGGSGLASAKGGVDEAPRDPCLEAHADILVQHSHDLPCISRKPALTRVCTSKSCKPDTWIGAVILKQANQHYPKDLCALPHHFALCPHRGDMLAQTAASGHWSPTHGLIRRADEGQPDAGFGLIRPGSLEPWSPTHANMP